MLKHIVLITLVGGMIIPQAAANLREQWHEQAAVSNCQAALPSFEGAFRKRPLGMRNEGTSTAFVSCGLTAESSGSSGIHQVSVAFTGGDVAMPVTCTLVNGRFTPGQANVFITKTIVVGAGESLARLRWTTLDNNDTSFTLANVSCGLPPGVELNKTLTMSDIEVGA